MLGKTKNKPEPEIVLDENTKEYYRFSYHLTQEEAYQAFSLLAFKWSRRYRLIAGIGIENPSAYTDLVLSLWTE